MPIVSIIVPCFNHSRYIVAALESILSQSFRDLEIIVVDDCSTDNSWEEISRIAERDGRVKPLRHTLNSGLPRSRNDGLKLAAGEFIAFCDSDDVWEHNKLERQLAQLSEHNDCDIVYCDSRIIDENGRFTGRLFSALYPMVGSHSGYLFPSLIKTNFINVQSAIIRRKCLSTVVGFDADLRALEDWWFWIQLSRTHKFYYESEPLARYRVHSQSMNATRKRSFPISRFKIYRRLCKIAPDLTTAAIAEIAYRMGFACMKVGKMRCARGLFCRSFGMSVTVSPSPRRAFIAFARLIGAFVYHR